MRPAYSPYGSQGGAETVEPLSLTNRGERAGAWILLAVGSLILLSGLWCLLVMVPDGMPVSLLLVLVLPGVLVLWGGVLGLRTRLGLTADTTGLTLITTRGNRYLTWDQVRGNLRPTITGASLAGTTARVAVLVDGNAVELPCTGVSGSNREAATQRAQIIINEILARDPGPGHGYPPAQGYSPAQVLSRSQGCPPAGGAAARPPRLVLEEPDSLQERRTASTVVGVSTTGVLFVMGVVFLLEGGIDTLGTVMAAILAVAGGLPVLAFLVAYLRNRGPYRTVADSTGITVHSGRRTEVLSWTQARGHLTASATQMRGGKVSLGWSAELSYQDDHRTVLLSGASVQGPTRTAALQAAQERIAHIASYDPAAAAAPWAQPEDALRPA